MCKFQSNLTFGREFQKTQKNFFAQFGVFIQFSTQPHYLLSSTKLISTLRIKRVEVSNSIFIIINFDSIIQFYSLGSSSIEIVLILTDY